MSSSRVQKILTVGAIVRRVYALSYPFWLFDEIQKLPDGGGAAFPKGVPYPLPPPGAVPILIRYHILNEISNSILLPYLMPDAKFLLRNFKIRLFHTST